MKGRGPKRAQLALLVGDQEQWTPRLLEVSCNYFHNVNFVLCSVFPGPAEWRRGGASVVLRRFAERSAQRRGSRGMKGVWAKHKAVKGGRRRLDAQLTPFSIWHKVKGCFLLQRGGSSIEEEAEVSTLLMVSCCQWQCEREPPTYEYSLFIMTYVFYCASILCVD